MVFFVDKLETSHERKTGGTSKKEESHDVAPGRNRGKGQKNVDFSSIKVSSFAESNSYGFKMYNM
jgi:hypothetical protein